jgi:DNA-binding NtrC family response regulator
MMGTTPRYRCCDPAGHRQLYPAQISNQSERNHSIVTLRILFVGKDVTLADLLVPSMERKRHQVALAHTRRQATARIRSTRTDLLIVDVASFGSKGYRISEAIRARLGGVASILLLPEGHQIAALRQMPS